MSTLVNISDTVQLGALAWCAHTRIYAAAVARHRAAGFGADGDRPEDPAEQHGGRLHHRERWRLNPNELRHWPAEHARRLRLCHARGHHQAPGRGEHALAALQLHAATSPTTGATTSLSRKACWGMERDRPEAGVHQWRHDSHARMDEPAGVGGGAARQPNPRGLDVSGQRKPHGQHRMQELQCAPPTHAHKCALTAPRARERWTLLVSRSDANMRVFACV